MATASPTLITRGLPVARAALAAARGGSVSRVLAVADSVARRSGSHPAMPAAVRIERARSSGNGTRSDQTAVTLWFGEGPALPAPGGSMRSAARVGAGVVATVALAALTAIAAQREQQRATLIEAPASARRLGS